MTTTIFSEERRPRQLKALGLTLGIHALLLLVFFTVKYAAPAPVPPPVEELGMEVNLGSSADGFGTEQPEITGDPAPEVAEASPAAEEATEPITAAPSNDPDAAEIPPKKETVKPQPPKPVTPKTATTSPVKATTPVTAVTKPAEVPRRPKVLFPGSRGTGGNGATRDVAGSSEGNTFGSGDRGVPGGTPGAKNYEGSPGRGTGGVNHTLSGRTIIAPRLEGNFRNGGSVKMRVTVNRAGAIVNSSVLSGSGELTAIAKDKLRQVRFSAAPDGPVEQFGTVTFVFKTQ